MRFLFLRSARLSKPARRTPSSIRPRLEALEDRTLLSAGWAIATGGSGGLIGVPALSQPDATGNVYVTGNFNGSVTFGSTTLTASSNNASFVAKVDANGNVLWAEQFGGLSGGNWNGIALDGSGNAYLSGNFDGTQSFGSMTLTSTSPYPTGYLCKVDPNGNFLWAQRFANSTSGSGGNNVAVDGNGNLYLSSHGNGSFLSKVDSSSGNFLWTQQVVTNTNGTTPSGVALDSSGNAYVSVNGGPGTYGGFLAKYDTNGNVIWSQATARPILGDAIYQNPTTGANWLYTAVWPTTGMPTDVQKIDAASGTVLWSQQIGSPSVRPFAIATDSSGNVYLTGSFGGAYGNQTTDFDPGPGVAILTAQATGYNSDAFVVKLDPSGNFLSVHSFGGPTASNDGRCVVVDSGGNIYTAGPFGGTTNFDTGSQIVSLASSASGSSLFVVKTTQDTGAIIGQVFNDLNNNGVFDPSSTNPETGIPNVTLYLDANNNGVLDPGETTATTDANGSYEFNHLAAGSYMVRQVTPSGWTQTYPSAGGANAVTLGTGQFVDTENFGDYTPSQTKSYASTNVPLKLKTNSGASITSTLTVNDTATIFALNLSINVTTTSTSLVFLLTSPDGTTVQVQAGTTHVTGFNYHGTKGTWTLKMYNSAPAPKPSTLNAWSFQILESTTTLNSPLSDSPNSVPTGSLTVLPRKLVPAETSSGASSVSDSSQATPSAAVGGTSNGSGTVELSSSVAEDLFADIALLLSAARSASQLQLSSMSAVWQSADELAVQCLDPLLNMEVGAMGMSKDALLRDLFFANVATSNG